MITARAGLLQALRQGPGYGRQLMRRVNRATKGRVSLGPGSVYPALRALKKAGLVRTWTVVVGRTRGGRARTYCELTPAGLREAETEAEAFAGLLPAGRAPRPPSPGELEAIRGRILRVAALFDFAREARASLAEARRSG